MKLKNKPVFIDTETLGRYDNAIILSIGLTMGSYAPPNPDRIGEFKRLVDTGLYIKLDVKSQRQAGRTHCEQTLDWWKSQGPEAQRVLLPSPGDQTLEQMHVHISRWLESHGENFKSIDLWERNNFDLSKLAHAYENDLKMTKVPWDYKQRFDIVQWAAAYGMDRYQGIRPEDIPGMVYHNALHDSALDQIRLSKMFAEAGLF